MPERIPDARNPFGSSIGLTPPGSSAGPSSPLPRRASATCRLIVPRRASARATSSAARSPRVKSDETGSSLSERPERPASATSRPTVSCASRNGIPRRAIASATSVARSASAEAALFDPGPVEREPRHERGHRGKAGRENAPHSENRFLVELHVLVVGERQPLEEREKARKLADRPPGVSAQQSEHVGVLLVGHPRRAGRQVVRKLEEPEFVRRKENHVPGEARQVGEQHRGAIEVVRRGIPIRHRVERVRARPAEAELAGERAPVHADRGPGQSSAPERAFVGAIFRLREPLRVAQEHFDVSEAPVAERDRLRAFPVRVRRHRRRGVALGAAGERFGDREQVLPRLPERSPQIDSEIGRDSVVSRAPRVELAAGRAGESRDFRFDERMDVLERAAAPGDPAGSNLPQGPSEAARLRRSQGPGSPQRGDPGERTLHVLAEQFPVELEGIVEVRSSSEGGSRSGLPTSSFGRKPSRLVRGGRGRHRHRGKAPPAPRLQPEEADEAGRVLGRVAGHVERGERRRCRARLATASDVTRRRTLEELDAHLAVDGLRHRLEEHRRATVPSGVNHWPK